MESYSPHAGLGQLKVSLIRFGFKASLTMFFFPIRFMLGLFVLLTCAKLAYFFFIFFSIARKSGNIFISSYDKSDGREEHKDLFY
jgi:hypothetical protein